MTPRRLLPAAVALTLLAGCGPNGATPAASAPAGPPVPPVVGLTLDQADTELQTAGFGQPGVRDALRDRSPGVRSDWQVCSQQPAPGPAPAGTTTVDVTIVRRSEACPVTATSPTAAATSTTAPPSRRHAVPTVPSTRHS